MSSPTLRIILKLNASDAIGSTWHTQLGEKKARLGVRDVGPRALVARLANLYGVAVPEASDGERAVVLHARLEELDDGKQWYSQTRQIDPLGAAQWLVRAHDELRDFGWDGQALRGSPRLEALSKLRESGAIGPGWADLEHEVLSGLKSWGASVPMRIEVNAARDAFSPMLGRILSASEACGVEVVDTTLEPAADKSTNLGRLQRALLEGGQIELRADDESLTWLQAPTPGEAAAFAIRFAPAGAAWLVTAEGAQLDRVRSSLDHPLFGISDPSRWRPALQVLPLALALQFRPRAPEAALELLTNPVCPVPYAVRTALVRALSRAPGVGGAEFLKAIDDGLERHAKDNPGAKLDELRARINILFPDEVEAKATVAQLKQLADTVAGWARGSAVMLDDAVRMAAGQVAVRLSTMLGSFDSSAELESHRVAQIHDLAIGDGISLPTTAEVGAPPCTSDPAGIAGAVEQLVWFGAVEGAAELGGAIHWSDAEREELNRVDAPPPVQGVRRVQEQEAWKRAALSARDRLILVSWSLSGQDKVGPHPLFDLVRASVARGELTRITMDLRRYLEDADEHDLDRVPPVSDRLPRISWRFESAAEALDRNWSASSVKTLINCPARWVFQYAASLSPGATGTLGDLRNIAGTFAHALFEEVLFEAEPGWDAMTPEYASQRLAQRFAERVEGEAATLTLPQNSQYRADLEGQLTRAIASLVENLKAGTWRPKAAEVGLAELAGELGGKPTAGSIDLLVENDDGHQAVIDLKLGGARYRTTQLRDGRAVQLAIYGQSLCGNGRDFPPAGYFILEDGILVSSDRTAFPKARTVDGPGTGATFMEVKEAWSFARDQVAAGIAVARSSQFEPKDYRELANAAVGREEDEHPWFDERASCEFCDQRRLCEFQLAWRDA